MHSRSKNPVIALAVVLCLSLTFPVPDGRGEASSTGSGTTAGSLPHATGSGGTLAGTESALLQRLLYGEETALQTPSPPRPPSQGLADILYGIETDNVGVLAFDEAQAPAVSGALGEFFARMIPLLPADRRVMPSLCWGGWEDAFRAARFSDASADDAGFSRSESAFLRSDTASELSCDGFVETQPPPHPLRRVEVVVVWDAFFPAQSSPGVSSAPAGASAASADGGAESPVLSSGPRSDFAEVTYAFGNSAEGILGTLGSANASRASFLLPAADLLDDADLGTLRIGIRRSSLGYDAPPGLYVDSVWLHVTRAEPEPPVLTPPSARNGDVLLAEVSQGEWHAQLVLRHPDPPLVDSSLTATGAVIDEGDSAGRSVVPDDAPLVMASADPTIGHPSWRRELWLRHVQSGAWVRVADDDSLAADPALELADGQLFWTGPGEGSVWKYNPLVHATESVSETSSGSVVMDFENAAGERMRLFYDAPSDEVRFAVAPSPSPLP